MKALSILLIICVGLVGCSICRPGLDANDRAVVNIWGNPSEPSLEFKIKSDGKLVLRKTVRGRVTTYEQDVGFNEIQTLLRTAIDAQDDIAETPNKNPEGVADGTYLRILIKDRPVKVAVYEHYGVEGHKLDFVEILLKRLRDSIPEDKWW